MIHLPDGRVVIASDPGQYVPTDRTVHVFKSHVEGIGWNALCGANNPVRPLWHDTDTDTVHELSGDTRYWLTQQELGRDTRLNCPACAVLLMHLKIQQDEEKQANGVKYQ